MNPFLNDSHSRSVLLYIIDALLIYLAYYLVFIFRFYLADDASVFNNLTPDDLNTNFLSFIIVGIPMGLSWSNFYEHPIKYSRRVYMAALSKVLVWALLAVSFLSFFNSWQSVSRFILLGSVGLGGFFVLIRFFILRSYCLDSQRKCRYQENILYVGNNNEIATFVTTLSNDISCSLNAVARFNPENESIDELEDKISDNDVERVIFLSKAASFNQISKAISLCELMGIESWVQTSFLQNNLARPSISSINSKPMLVFSSTPELSFSLFAKQIFDRICAFIALIFAAIPIAIAAILIKLNDPKGPVFFKQDRAGRYGKAFKMWKLRTMYTDAEERLQKLKETHGNDMSGPVFKLENDPRIIKGGHILRKTSIDELPQLINVFLGDMSIVGPRPLPMYEVALFEKHAHRRRLSVKPGITCTWQAGGRNTITEFEDWVKMDLEYIDNWSFWLDIKLILKTVPAVLFSKGAK